MAHKEQWLTVRDICDRLGVNERTVRRWIQRGELPAVELGQRAGYRIAASDFDRFMDARKKVPEFSPEDMEEEEDV